MKLSVALCALLMGCVPVAVPSPLPDKPASIMQPCAPKTELHKGDTLRDSLVANAKNKKALADCSSDQAAEAQFISNLYKKK